MGNEYPLMAFAIGLALFTCTWVCWTGRWRRWAESPGLFGRNTLIAVPPAFAVLALAFGLSWSLPEAYEVPLQGVGFLFMLGGVVLHLWEPEWYGPKWFRRVHHAFQNGATASFAYMAEDSRRPGESSAAATERHVYSERPNPPGKSVKLLSETSGRIGGIEGRSSSLLFFPHAPVFAVQGTRERLPVNEVIAAESLRGVRQLEPGVGLDGSVRYSDWRSRRVPRVRIDTDEGSWLFQSRHAKRIVREIEWRYLDDSRDMYGLPLDDGVPVGHSESSDSDDTSR